MRLLITCIINITKCVSFILIMWVIIVSMRTWARQYHIGACVQWWQPHFRLILYRYTVIGQLNKNDRGSIKWRSYDMELYYAAPEHPYIFNYVNLSLMHCLAKETSEITTIKVITLHHWQLYKPVQKKVVLQEYTYIKTNVFN